MIKPIVSVDSPGMNQPRKGRGFSKNELAAVKLSVKEAREAGLIIDERRKSKHSENVETLKKFKLDYTKFLADQEKIKAKVRRESTKARKEAKKRKEEEMVLDAAKAKEIEAEKKKIQEELAKREAEELEEETVEEELTDDELAELDALEDGAITADEETPEDALEKLEEDLADSLKEKEPEPEKPATPDGTKKVVKRVRKKPTTTTKGVSEKAEKKE